MSLPSRERGLKYRLYLIIHLRVKSLPSRERGLKCDIGFLKWASQQVAPFAGAWIEIVLFGNCCRVLRVAPFAGAWIEISSSHALTPVFASLPSRERGLKLLPLMQSNQRQESLPSRERGLKYKVRYVLVILNDVAPFAGAWIEICDTHKRAHRYWSLPSRERGLKYLHRLHHSVSR